MPLTGAKETYQRIKTVNSFRIGNLASSDSNTLYIDIRLKWQQPDGNQSNRNTIGFDTGVAGVTASEGNRFIQLRNAYEEYAITGLCFMFDPVNTAAAYYAGNTVPVNLTSIWSWTDPTLETETQYDAELLQKTSL